MKLKINLVCLLMAYVLSLGCENLKNQNTKDTLLVESFSKDQYLEDLNQFVEVITENHPYPYQFTSKTAFDSIVSQKISDINDETVFNDFIWMCSEILASVGCSHSGLGFFNQEDKIIPYQSRFPIEARLIEDRLYVTDPLINGDKINKGQEIIAINGKSVLDIQTEAFKHINAQAHIATWKRILFNAYFTAYISFVLDFPEVYEVTLINESKSIKLSSLETDYKYKPLINPDLECQDNLCLQFNDSKSVAILTIRSFAYYKEDEWKTYTAFIDESFKKINAKEYKNLIIDVRGNGGGPSSAALYLCLFFAKNPFKFLSDKSDFASNTQEFSPSKNSFKGDTYVLIDGGGHSTTGFFGSVVKANQWATLIGEELGSNHFCTANQKEFELNNTGITFTVARNTTFTVVDEFPKDKGIYPDYYVHQPISDYLNNIDTVKEYALDIIRNEE